MSVLLELGYDPSDGGSLFFSIYNENRDVARVLFEDGRSDTNAYDDEDYDTMLHYTVVRGDVEFTRLLLANPRTNPDQEHYSEYGLFTSIENACHWIGEIDESNWKGISECIQLVLDDSRTTAFDGLLLLELSNYNPVVTPIVIRAWIRDGAYHTSELETLCSQGQAGAISLLLKYCKCDPTNDDSCCLRIAIERGFSTVVKILLSDGRTDPRADNDYCIEEAAALGDVQTVTALLADLRVVSDANNDASMRLAQEGGHTGVIALLQSHRKQTRAVTRRRRQGRRA